MGSNVMVRIVTFITSTALLVVLIVVNVLPATAQQIALPAAIGIVDPIDSSQMLRIEGGGARTTIKGYSGEPLTQTVTFDTPGSFFLFVNPDFVREALAPTNLPEFTSLTAGNDSDAFQQIRVEVRPLKPGTSRCVVENLGTIRAEVTTFVVPPRDSIHLTYPDPLRVKQASTPWCLLVSVTSGSAGRTHLTAVARMA